MLGIRRGTLVVALGRRWGRGQWRRLLLGHHHHNRVALGVGARLDGAAHKHTTEQSKYKR